MSFKQVENLSRNKIIRILLRILMAGIAVAVLIAGIITTLIFLGAFGPIPSKPELADIKNESATLVYSQDQVLIGKIFAKNHTPVTKEDLPQHLIDALICTEDVRFYNHNGIDNRSLLRVIIKSILMGNRSYGGGSTITQQLAKNLYGRNDFGVMSLPINKIREAVIALRLEDVYSKDDILVLYLNIVPFGEEVFGIEAAANRYFNKTAAGLEVDESALLVGLLKGNTYYHPVLHPERALERRNLVMQLMYEEQKLDSATCEKYIKRPLDLDYSNLSHEGPAQYFLFQVEKKAREILDNLKNKGDGEYEIEKDGLIIQTTLDLRLQELAREAIHKHLSAKQLLFTEDPSVKGQKYKLESTFDNTIPENRELWTWNGVEVREITKLDSAWHYESTLNAGTLIMDPNTGKVKVWIGGNHFRYLPYDLVLAKRMIASSFKPILYATAFENGTKPCDYLDNEEKVYEEYDNWIPKNYDGSSGDEVAVWYALAHSLNIPSVDLYFKVKPKDLKDMCGALGFEEIPPGEPSVALGTMNLSLYEATRAYAAFAAKGKLPDPILIEHIKTPDGELLYEHKPTSGEEILNIETAGIITTILQKAVNEGTGVRIRSQFGIRSDLAGKTGTSQEYSDAWFFCYTPDLVCGVWVGARDPSIHFSSGNNGSGSALALPVAGQILKEIEKQPDLRRAYLTSFHLPAEYDEMLNCEGTRTKGAWNRFFDSIFKRDKERQDSLDINEEGKVKRFFKNLFRKKD